MPKRKRDDDVSVDALFSRFRTDLFHALKTAKGFTRQRQSKRLRDSKSTPDKKARIEKEIAVLKSLDLRQTAHAHLCSSLLKIKAIADSDKLPDEIRAGVPKPELTEEEKALLHNVTSALYNQAKVKAVVEKAVEAVCEALGVPVPEKKGRVRKKDKGGAESKANGEEQSRKEEQRTEKSNGVKDEVDDGEPGNNHGMGKKDKKRGQDKAGLGDGEEEVDGDDSDEEEEERAVSQLDRFLGLDSDEEADDDEEEMLVKGRTRKANAVRDLDPMEITTDEEGGDDDDDDADDLDPMEITSDEGQEGGSSEDEFHGFSDSAHEMQDSSSSEDEDDAGASETGSSASSIARSPPTKKIAASKQAGKAAKALKPMDSTFLPTLMGGYISGSESEASDIDVAPRRKNRRGQRARRAIWEKKYGEKAKHLQQPAKGRDAGWDLKRGAVDGDSKPWKRGIRNPLLDKKPSGAGEAKEAAPKKEPPQRKRDDTGPLHPSWEARRQAKAKQQLSVPFQGKKITF
ncbi:uncharacterized protein THITE_2110443, partial [Thermothielavioides terrestris NRRL 8126]